MSDTTEIQRDIADTTAALDRLRTAYLAKSMQRGATRAITTTYNAKAGQLCQRRDELRLMLKNAASAT